MYILHLALKMTTMNRCNTLLLPRNMLIDRVAGAIIRLVASVSVSVRLSVGTLLFEQFDL